VKVLTVVAPSATGSDRGGTVPRASGGCPSSIQMLYTGSQQSLTIAAGTSMNIDVQIVDNCGNPITSAMNASVTAAFSTGDPTMNLVHTTNGHWVGTWQPRAVTSGTATVTITAFVVYGNGSFLANQISVPVTLSGGNIATPSIKPGGVANAASFAPGEVLAPGSLVSIFGTGLAADTESSNSTPLQTNLANTEVRLNDQPLPLLYASNGQINAQLPFNIPTNTPLQLLVRRGGTQSYPETVTIAPVQPGVFVNPTTGLGIILNPDGSLNSPSSPAHPGDTVVIYCTGLGLVNPAVPAGAVATGQASTLNPVTVTVNGRPLSPFYAGLTPGYAGLYQINLTLPSDIFTADALQLVVSAANLNSPPVIIAIH